ncbi:MAG: ornithine cyclodeaminase family protein, partial [Acidobacteriota bacterium]|nr:ornithine cyclodeaminase family protein [Acidobacteriota bacterium]
MSAAGGVLLLSRSEVAARISLSECVAAVEAALIAESEGRVLRTAVASVPSEGGGFHVKAGGFPSPLARFVAKVNSNFSGNPERFGLPAIQGVLLLADAVHGTPLALMDSIEITIQRTGAATAVAAKRLARPDSRVATICGCGAQGRIQAAALAHVLPIERFFLCDSDPRRAESLAEHLRRTLGISAVAREDLQSAVSESDVCVTCTPSRRPFLWRGHVRAGTFVAAVGADNPLKQELDSGLLVSNKVVV